MKKVVYIAVVACMIVFVVSAVFAAQQIGTMPLPKRPMPADIIQVVNLVLESPACPRDADRLALKLTVKNVSGNTLQSVPWLIRNPYGRLGICGEGVRTNVAPNESFQVTCTTEPQAAGEHTFRGYADPNNTLGESGGGVTPLNHTLNNAKDLVVKVMTRGAIPGTETYLDAQKAKAAGAAFSEQHGNTPCRITLNEAYNNLTNEISIDCTHNLLGGKVDFELYKNFTLKNGWKVDRIDADQMRQDPTHGSRFEVKPQPGSNNPYMKIHSWADRKFSKRDLINIHITGPFCTDPYQ